MPAFARPALNFLHPCPGQHLSQIALAWPGTPRMERLALLAAKALTRPTACRACRAQRTYTAPRREPRPFKAAPRTAQLRAAPCPPRRATAFATRDTKTFLLIRCCSSAAKRASQASTSPRQDRTAAHRVLQATTLASLPPHHSTPAFRAMKMPHLCWPAILIPRASVLRGTTQSGTIRMVPGLGRVLRAKQACTSQQQARPAA